MAFNEKWKTIYLEHLYSCLLRNVDGYLDSNETQAVLPCLLGFIFLVALGLLEKCLAEITTLTNAAPIEHY